jgi:hypothetical protein
MKTTDEQIEKMAREYADKDLLTRVGLYDYGLRVMSYKAGFKACEAKMLAEATKNFEEFIFKFERSDAYSMRHMEKSYAAGAMSQARKNVEMEKFLVSIINWDNLSKEEMITAQELHQKHFPENYKQGGER